eukprot:TRINITY_DN63992_c0_g1_i1.p1 TRINITY_DN63992_c0_g1~~TRINITY_DN63992_c0_g1_i1.p1  ORF type:complete len:246 (+),score=55.17 TRINITY_DN63992_c0_g1_i1:89-826(+)
MLKVVLVRHGQSMANIDHRIGRCPESPLSELGRRQAEMLGRFRKAELEKAAEDGCIFSSTALRAKETALLALEGAGLSGGEKLLKLSEKLTEIHRGDWEGRCFEEVKEQWKIHIDCNIQTGKAPGQGAESRADVEDRVEEFFKSTTLFMEEMASDGDDCTLFIFAHYVTVSCILTRMAGVDPRHRFDFENTSCTVLERKAKAEVGKAAWSIKGINNAQHLFRDELRPAAHITYDADTVATKRRRT